MEEEFEDVKTIRGMCLTFDKYQELQSLEEVSKMNGMNITVHFFKTNESKWTPTSYSINIFDKKSEMYFKLRFAGTLI